MNLKKRKLTEKEREELQSYKTSKDCTASELKRIIALLLLDNRSDNNLIVQLTGFKKNYAFKLRKKYKIKGIKGLIDRPKKKPRALLTKGQRAQIINILRTTTPQIFGFEHDSWTSSLLGMLIKEQYNVQYKSKTSLYLIFREAKFTYHQPGTQYKKRNPEKIEEWKKNEGASIKEHMKDENTIVLFEDEMMFSSQTTTQKIWLPQGQYPKIDIASKREVRCIYGFINISTGQQHAFKSMRAASVETCKFLDKIGKYYKNKKIVIVWDNASWHRSKEIKDYLSSTKYNFHLIALPPYAPELNPQEHVWKYGRSHVTHNRFISNIDKIASQLVNFLNSSSFDYKFL